MGRDIYAESLDLHERHQGKIGVRGKVPVRTVHDLALTYTPGVAEVCRQIAAAPDLAYRYTLKANTVAIVSDGSAVLGLGDIGGYGAIPVMEGKALLFREFAGIDAFPICFADKDQDLVGQIRNIAPVFGGINLEDIAAPRCFAIEEELQDLGIPVMHDDQHGTGVVVLAALVNACQLIGKEFADLKIVVSGAGAAGYGITRLLTCLGMDRMLCTPVGEIIVCDSRGTLYRGRSDLLSLPHKYILAHETNRWNLDGTLADALVGADVFIGVSAPGIVTTEMVRSMNDDPIVLAMANPVPEIMPGEAAAAGAAIVGTGRSDFPNQVNNVLAFPGIFRGALDAAASRITDEMKLAAAAALAATVDEPRPDHILPDVLDRRVAGAVAAGVQEAAVRCGCARRHAPAQRV
ncbi:NADP-dependent malic enzyme [Methanofollis formosanus]|uniref:NADP-dependent malic enzyme n=1 Tax=Methanofollis formosanus TaxID=299308 RepID=A0A8G0ZZJ1_9EURY|nr:NADP-dependent malic enzyme [Methanofollis formosanus]QYZ78351.1 NADP-dependent malic enzyme [Methanofollis formosanus]